MTYKLADTSVMHCAADGRAILIDAATGAMFSLNRTCASICRAIKDAPRTLDEILGILGQTMELPPAAPKDISSLLGVLKAKGLLE